ncbi:hypothetical protein V2W45_1470940 [Cenococcum geophilum]
MSFTIGRPILSVLRLLNIIKDLPTKEMGELANKFKDFKVELRSLPKGALFKHIPTQPSGGIDLSHFLIQNEEPADEPFDEPSVLYNKVLGGLEDKVVILKAGEDNNLWLNNAESRHLSYSINLAEQRVLELKGPILN